MWRKTWNIIRAGAPYLHDLGECEVKHGVPIGLANLYDSEIGNSQMPKQMQPAAPKVSTCRNCGGVQVARKHRVACSAA